MTRLERVLDGDFAPTWRPSVYLLRHGRYVFYIGKANDPVKRLREHCGWTVKGGYGWQHSKVGELVDDNNLPDSDTWIVELYDPEEWGSPVIEEAERAAIAHHRPALNVVANPRRPYLRPRYASWRRASLLRDWAYRKVERLYDDDWDRIHDEAHALMDDPVFAAPFLPLPQEA